jgi:hypothetical protein
MANRLRDRQARLLDYLTSSAAIFGGDGEASLPPELQGIDPALLRLEARFSYQKRMDKIAAVFPRTFARLGEGGNTILRAFVDASPPDDIGRLTNARQFYDFLLFHWLSHPPDPPYLRDIAACELAFATVRAGETKSDVASARSAQSIRRYPGAILLRCAYDVRAIFEDDADAPPLERETRLAVMAPVGSGDPRVLELPPAIFSLLGALDDWTDPQAFAATPDSDALVRNLAAHGLIEVAR